MQKCRKETLKVHHNFNADKYHLYLKKTKKNKSVPGKFHEKLSHSFLPFTDIDKPAIYILD